MFCVCVCVCIMYLWIPYPSKYLQNAKCTSISSNITKISHVSSSNDKLHFQREKNCLKKERKEGKRERQTHRQTDLFVEEMDEGAKKGKGDGREGVWVASGTMSRSVPLT